MRLGFTTHAVDQFIRRHAPHLSHDEARATLEAAAPGAKKLREKTLKRDTQWEIPSLGIILVTKEERGEWVVVTVLPSPNAPAPLPPLDFDDCLPRVVAPEPPKPPPPPVITLAPAWTREAPKVELPPDPTPSRKELEARIRCLENEVAQAQRSREILREKTARHTEMTDREASEARHALRLALRWILAYAHPAETVELFEQIRALNPSFLDEAFISFEKRSSTATSSPTTNDLRGLAAREAGE
jgi:hypothetical protein